MKILITGFEPFGGEVINPAYEAVKRLPDSIGDCQIIKREIPTVFNKSIAVLQRDIEMINPDIVICVGQAGGRFNICPELVAINKSEARIPDNEGNQPCDESIYQDGPNAYFSTLPCKAIVKTLGEAGIPAQLSYTAGTYVCNHIFYGLMYTIERQELAIRGGFIHVPYSSEQVVGRKNTPFMSLEQIVEGLRIVIEATIANPTDIVMTAGDIH